MLGNWLKTAVLMAAIVALFGAVGAALGGQGGMMMALALAAGMNVYAYWFSDKAVLKMYGAQEVTPDNVQFRNYYNMVKTLAENAQLPMPKVYVMDEAQPNAFATGRNPEHAAVAATTGIMQALSERELRGVMAHELAHIKHRDTLISTISATIAGAISSIGTFGMLFGGGRNDSGERSVSPVVAMLMMFLAPMAASLIQMAISRSREFEADRVGAEISRDPKALASALGKIHNYAHQIANPTAEAHPETGQMMIINPLSGVSFDSLFSTHPKTEERVARLMAMASSY
ncbi:MAG: zinc metalloprotease HtpX [Methylotenera sp.]|uniref:zinc metalloprotease HtpX n=1 Tax=Methylotenera sp. TaxID=2051956 RepID=UPI00271A5750|nr:zinc metalloprotease HtpX [Methylotenera sp.]MDO9204223.1 zinc metalloprotease HtpX [Methylotenera sp.]MDO9393619.1 zinc metalloprotease HtpX [Methylotenera sp.]MDP1523889.1 zinc metalloprotease HtpX [Methylotenera sp.]MDZ4212528.1 zinc metalloprotease HtpX [Methylotenera sp.]